MQVNALRELAERRELFGVYAGIGIEDYHAGPGHSNSGLKHVKRSVAHYEHERAKGGKKTKAMVEGSWFHALMEDEEGFLAQVEPIEAGVNWGTKAYEKLQAGFPGKTLIAEDVLARLRRMQERALSNPHVARFQQGHRELSGYWADPETGLLLKCRPDVYHEDLRFLIDYKTTEDASDEEFARSCSNFGYHRQAAMALDGFNAATRQRTKKQLGVDPGDVVDAFVLVAVESAEPHGLALYCLDPQDVELGRRQYLARVRRVAEVAQAQREASYPQDIQTLRLPGWAQYEW